MARRSLDNHAMDFSGMSGSGLPDGAATLQARVLAKAQHAADASDTSHIIRVLLILSLALASISVLMTLWTLYWFVRIRRSFRHELILLLIQSDFLKSLVFVVFPIVSFAWGSVQSDSTFCQLSGFALAVGIESSDVAVLLIAVHSAMYIFRPRSGLFPYRQYAYLLFYLYPVTAASLAFINGNGYENLGHYCYLRTDRSWARLALNWVPRYVVCVSIVAIYAFIYLYIRRRMGDYGRRRSEAMHSQSGGGSHRTQSIPRLSYHGLIPSTPCSRRTSATDTITGSKDRLRAGSLQSSAEAPDAKGNVNWNWLGFTQSQNPSGSRRSVDDTPDPASPKAAALPTPPTAHIPHLRLPEPDNAPESLPSTRRVSFQRSLPDGSPLNPPEPSHAGLSPPPPQRASTTTTTATSKPTHPTPSIDLTTSDPADPDQQRKKTLRQLRSLFIYPLVYIIVWLFPFVSHILGYDDTSNHRHTASSTNTNTNADADPVTARAPAWLLVVSLLSLCVQGAADCAVFLWRETPWRHAAGRGFLAALGKRWAWRKSRLGRAIMVRAAAAARGGGRTREEMLVDGRLARERRAGEVALERERGREMGRERREGSRREWWDVYAEAGLSGGDDDDDDGDDGDDGSGESGGRREV